jgi:hypothetical protein
MPPPERPAPRTGPRRATVNPAKIPSSGPPIGKIAPYVAMALAVIGPLYVLLKVPKYASHGAMAITVVVALGCCWLALTARPSVKPGDSLRTLLPIVAFASTAAAIIPFAYTIYPPAPRGEVRLANDGDSGTVRVEGMSSTLWITVSGNFVPNATGSANYFLNVTHDGRTERIDGTLHPHAGGPLPERHVLGMRGNGVYTIRLEEHSSAVAPPLVVGLSAKPFSTLLLIMLFASLAVAILAVDVMIYRRGIEPAFAASLLLPIVAAVYFQRNPGTNTVGQDLLAAGVIGLLGGGIGGEVLARGARSLLGK